MIDIGEFAEKHGGEVTATGVIGFYLGKRIWLVKDGVLTPEGQSLEEGASAKTYPVERGLKPAPKKTINALPNADDLL